MKANDEVSMLVDLMSTTVELNNMLENNETDVTGGLNSSVYDIYRLERSYFEASMNDEDDLAERIATQIDENRSGSGTYRNLKKMLDDGIITEEEYYMVN